MRSAYVPSNAGRASFVPARVLLLLALVLGSTLSSGPARGDTAASAFGATKFPFVPRLVVDREPALCPTVLRIARMQFLSDAVDMSVRPKDEYGIHWVEWAGVKGGDIPAGGAASWVELDLDGTGKKELVVLREVDNGWRGVIWYAFVFPGKAAFEAAMEIVGSREEFGTGTRYYPDGQLPSGEVVDGDEHSPHRLFELQGRYYFHGEGRWYLTERSRVRSVYRLRAGGKVALVCRVKLQPEPEEVALGDVVEGFSSYLAVLRTIGTGGVGNCGSLSANIWHDLSAEGTARGAFVRPWAVPSDRRGNQEHSPAMRQLLEDWSFDGVWNRREYQTFLEHHEPALKGLERHLRRTFGTSEAQAPRRAREVFEAVTAARFVVPREYLDTERVDRLRKQVIEGIVGPEDFDELASANRAFQVEPGYPSPAPYLHDAVEAPEVAGRLLDGGADVDARNAFGKTPLMMAAHMNRPDVVELLLKRKASVDARTFQVSDCGLVVERAQRTALMYAAENAGVEVLRLLVEAGADTKAVDSRGNGVSYYLAKNPYLTEEQKRMDVDALVKSVRPVLGPSFKCGQSLRPVERLVCSNRVLAMQDRYLADAYGRWVSRKGEEARKEQRAWLARRNKTCSSLDKAEALLCLQQSTRARIRYLQNRLAEPATSTTASRR